MSIGSIQNLGPIIDVSSSNTQARVRPAQPQPSPGPDTQQFPPQANNTVRGEVNSGNLHTAATSGLSQDKVQVQHDGQVQDQIVIKYLDQNTGDLILQVPSDEVLNVDRGIYQEFASQARARENLAAAPVAQEGENNGH